MPSTLASGNHTEGRVTDDGKDQNQAKSNSDHACNLKMRSVILRTTRQISRFFLQLIHFDAITPGAAHAVEPNLSNDEHGLVAPAHTPKRVLDKTLAGIPITIVRGGTSSSPQNLPRRGHPRPMVTPFKTMAPMPTKQPSFKVAPWITAR
jgi:hypothetical protein